MASCGGWWILFTFSSHYRSLYLEVVESFHENIFWDYSNLLLRQHVAFGGHFSGIVLKEALNICVQYGMLTFLSMNIDKNVIMRMLLCPERKGQFFS